MRFLLSMIICPVFEKTLSEGTELATMQCLPTLTNALPFIKSVSPSLSVALCTWPVPLHSLSSECVSPFLLSHNGMILVYPPMWFVACVFFIIFFVTKKCIKIRLLWKHWIKKIAYQHTSHSQLLNWAKIEGFGWRFGSPWRELALLVRYKESALRAGSFTNDTSLDQTSSVSLPVLTCSHHITWDLTPYHIVLSGRAATANRGHSDINHPPAPPVSVEGKSLTPGKEETKSDNICTC